jgi:hypothetical protein
MSNPKKPAPNRMPDPNPSKEYTIPEFVEEPSPVEYNPDLQSHIIDDGDSDAPSTPPPRTLDKMATQILTGVREQIPDARGEEIERKATVRLMKLFDNDHDLRDEALRLGTEVAVSLAHESIKHPRSNKYRVADDE